MIKFIKAWWKNSAFLIWYKGIPYAVYCSYITAVDPTELDKPAKVEVWRRYDVPALDICYTCLVDSRDYVIYHIKCIIRDKFEKQ